MLAQKSITETTVLQQQSHKKNDRLQILQDG
jgi:hypothetical protein